MESEAQEIAEAIWGTLRSPNEVDRNLEAANVVDGLYMIARAIERHAEAMEKVAGAMEELTFTFRHVSSDGSLNVSVETAG